MPVTREKLKNFASSDRVSPVSIFFAVIFVLIAIVQFASGSDAARQSEPGMVATELDFTSSIAGDNGRSCTPLVGAGEEDIARNEILKSLRKLVFSVSGQAVCKE